MLHWHSNFQIPNSAVQAADVYAVVEGKTINFYGDLDRTIFLYSKDHNFEGNSDPYDYLLSLEEYSNYIKVK